MCKSPSSFKFFTFQVNFSCKFSKNTVVVFKLVVIIQILATNFSCFANFLVVIPIFQFKKPKVTLQEEKLACDLTQFSVK